VGDIVLVMLLTYASGGISSGLPLLLLTSLAAAGLVSRGRLSLFFAAIASLGVLLEHTLQVLWHEGATAQYVQAGLVSIGYFAIAILAHTLVRYLAESEQRAAQREIDLANLSQVNQLVIQDMHDGVLVVGAMPRGRREVLLRDYAPRLSTRLKEWSVNPVTGFDPVSTTVLAQQMNVRIVPVGRTRKVGAVIFLEDLSQVQAQAQQMKLASMGRLTANIAHEIRNPLSAISHAAELLQEETMPNPTISRLLRIITDNSLRLDRIVQDVLRLNRGEAAASQSFRVGEFLGLFVEQFCQSERLPAGLLAVEVNGDPKVRFDHGHFSQVLWNLCRNALRHCQRAEGSIRIAAGPGRDNRVRLDLFDDGPGVPPQLRGQLFEPFFTTDAGGTGLGLYLAREICQANGATLEYVENPGGAQFTIVCQGAS
jgi:two-component system sensor histidine kinase PilS (NtrC family)